LVESAKNPSISLTINEKKLISAIKSEILIQETEEPIISTRKLRKVYKVHPNYISGALENLLKNGIISRKKAIYSGKIKTFKYSIL
jgi:DNA-binding transcriptional regulator YhcF (GntR family)